MGTFNQIILVGNLTRDPVLNTTSTGKDVAKFSLAVNNPRNKEDVTYVDCAAWQQLSKFAGTYLKKGTSVMVVGRLSIRPYEDKDGNKRKGTEVMVQTIQLLGSKSAASTETEAPAAAEAEEIPF